MCFPQLVQFLFYTVSMKCSLWFVDRFIFQWRYFRKIRSYSKWAMRSETLNLTAVIQFLWALFRLYFWRQFQILHRVLILQEIIEKFSISVDFETRKFILFSPKWHFILYLGLMSIFCPTSWKNSNFIRQVLKVTNRPRKLVTIEKKVRLFLLMYHSFIFISLSLQLQVWWCYWLKITQFLFSLSIFQHTSENSNSVTAKIAEFPPNFVDDVHKSIIGFRIALDEICDSGTWIMIVLVIGGIDKGFEFRVENHLAHWKS